MEKQDEACRPRLRIVDTSGPEFARRPSRGKRRGRSYAKKHRQGPPSADVIQLNPRERAHYVASLGNNALRSLADQIRALGPPNAALKQIIMNAEAEAARFRMLLEQVYEDDR